jgi:DNA repair protein RecO (recombination protein O)
MIITTPAIVMKSLDFQESSKIITLLTPEHGKFAVLARGIKKPKSKFAGFFEIGSVLEVIVHLKSSRSVQTLSDVNFRQKNWNLVKDFSKLAIVMATMEMIDQLVHEKEACQDFFSFCENLIEWIDGSDEDVTQIFPYVLLRLAEISGIGLQSDEVQNFDEQIEIPSQYLLQRPIYLNIEQGMLSYEPGMGMSYKLSGGQAQYLLMLLKGKKKMIFRNPLPQSELKLLKHHLDVYFRHHIDGFRERRTDAIFDQLF